jgi:biotin transporter BioY
MDSAWALARSGLPITYQSAQRMLSAALRGEKIASLTCDSMLACGRDPR